MTILQNIRRSILLVIKVWHPDVAGNTEWNNIVAGFLIRSLKQVEERIKLAK